MSKKFHHTLWSLSGVLLIALFGIALHRFKKPEGTQRMRPHPDEPGWAEWAVDDTLGNKFFTRYIDTLTLDTMYFVCRLNASGDTVPDLLAVTYANDSTVSFRYYLNNQGDTVLLDYFQPQADRAVLSDSLQRRTDSLFLAAQDSVFTAEGQQLVDEISGYLDRINRTGIEAANHIAVTDTASATSDTLPARRRTFNTILAKDHPDEKPHTP